MTEQADKKVVLVGGCFDVIHFGHVEFLRRAKQHGNHLLVALEADENVRRRKGSTRPIHSQEQRKKMLEALSFVDEVLALPVMTKDQEYYDLVERTKPHVIAVTEGDPYQAHKQHQADHVGAMLVVIPKVHTPSTSQLAKLIGLE